MRLLGQRQGHALLMAVAIVRASAFALVPGAPIPMGLCEEGCGTPAHAMGCVTGGVT